MPAFAKKSNQVAAPVARPVARPAVPTARPVAAVRAPAPVVAPRPAVRPSMQAKPIAAGNSGAVPANVGRASAEKQQLDRIEGKIDKLMLCVQPGASVASISAPKAAPPTVRPAVAARQAATVASATASVTPTAASSSDLSAMNRMDMINLAKSMGLELPQGIKAEDLRAMLTDAMAGGTDAAQEGQVSGDVVLDPITEAKATTLMQLITDNSENDDLAQSIAELGCGADCLRCPGPETGGDSITQIGQCHASIHTFLGVPEPEYETA